MPVETSQRHKIPLSICFHKIEEETVEDNLQKEKNTRRSSSPGSTRTHLDSSTILHSTYLVLIDAELSAVFLCCRLFSSLSLNIPETNNQSLTRAVNSCSGRFCTLGNGARSVNVTLI